MLWRERLRAELRVLRSQSHGAQEKWSCGGPESNPHRRHRPAYRTHSQTVSGQINVLFDVPIVPKERKKIYLSLKKSKRSTNDGVIHVSGSILVFIYVI